MSEQLISESPEHLISEPSEPWWHYTDWFEGLSHGDITNRVLGSVGDREPGDYVVLPAFYVARIHQSAQEAAHQLMASTVSTAALAERIYMAMLQRDGYSTEHVKRAWAEAEAFVRRAAGAGGTGNAGGGQ